MKGASERLNEGRWAALAAGFRTAWRGHDRSVLRVNMWAGAGGPPNPALLTRNAYIGMIETAAEQLAKLPPQPGTTQMTAANSTPLTDGASAIAPASAWAMPLASKRASLTPEQIDIWEVHEAFSAQALGVLRELPNQPWGFTVPDDKPTPNGGAVSIGHPFGATGTRYVLTPATELAERNAPTRAEERR